MNDQALAEHDRRPPTPLDAPRVLLMLMSPRLREALATLLRMRGMNVAEADTADHALHAARESRSTVVVLDPRLPEVGIRIIGKLHATDPRLRVIAYTDWTPNVEQVLLRAGAYRVILKGSGAIKAVVEEIDGAHDAYRVDASVRLLLVDPSEDARAGMVELFCAMGMAVLPATEGRAAVALAQSEQPTIAVIDLSTGSGEGGGLRGIQVASRLLDLTPAPQVLFLSAVGDSRDDAIRLNYRAYPVIRKGDFETLVAKVREAQAALLAWTISTRTRSSSARRSPLRPDRRTPCPGQGPAQECAAGPHRLKPGVRSSSSLPRPVARTAPPVSSPPDRRGARPSQENGREHARGRSSGPCTGSSSASAVVVQRLQHASPLLQVPGTASMSTRCPAG